ncbi:MAG TPA: response regulator transcription factor [Candidatus Obscuribacterales bacterium]
MAKILIVEDDSALSVTIRDWLTYEHHIVEIAASGADALALLGASGYDLVVLDLSIPKVQGIDVLRAYREKGGLAPVLILTGKGDLDDKEEGFDAGADDYVTKPVHLRELSARVKALLRRPREIVQEKLRFGSLELDPSAYRVTKDGKELRLAKMEFALLEFLMRHPGQVFSPSTLLERVWVSESERSPESLRTLIKKLRQKIDSPGQTSHIENVHGVGYRFQPNEAC